MKEKFIRILSPISICVILMLDAAVIFLGYYCIQKLNGLLTAGKLIFLFVEIFTFIIAILSTKEVFSHGVIFHQEEFEITALDTDNIFRYEDISKIEIHKDIKASLTKNFNDRHSFIILTMNDEKTVTVDLGLTTKKTLDKVKKEISERAKINQ